MWWVKDFRRPGLQATHSVTMYPCACHRVRTLRPHPRPATTLPRPPSVSKAESCLSPPRVPAGERILASGSVQLPRFTLLESGSLLISPTHISDAGTYTCLATNSRGVDEASADLVVWGECAELRCVTCLGVSVPLQGTHSHCPHRHLHVFLQEGLGQINSEERDQKGQGSLDDAR